MMASGQAPDNRSVRIVRKTIFGVHDYTFNAFRNHPNFNFLSLQFYFLVQKWASATSRQGLCMNASHCWERWRLGYNVHQSVPYLQCRVISYANESWKRAHGGDL